MSDLRQAVATLAEYVSSDNMDVPDSVRQAAGVYAQACQKANERLVACDQLLRSGQRAEALRQAQLEPDILKLYADLEFPGRQLWYDTAGRVGLTVPQQLNAVVARRLNKAFAESQTTDDLLRQHRTLALSRAPLQRRLDVLRLLAKAEPTNLSWVDDIRAYETVRFEEIRADVADSNWQLNWEAVCGVYEDLSSDAWVTPRPLDLLGIVQDAHARLRRTQGERILQAINVRLARAVGEGNLDSARELEARVVSVVKEYGIPDDSRLLATYRQAASWIDHALEYQKKERQFVQAVDQLRGALKDGVDWVYVQEYYWIAREFEPEFSLPPDLATEIAARARFRSMLRWGGVIGAVAIGCAILVAIVIFR